MTKKILVYIISWQFFTTTTYAQQEKLLALEDTSIQKEVLLGSSKSIKNYWLQIRNLYPAKEQNLVDSWILLNEDQILPERKIISLNKTQNSLRILVSDDKTTNNIEINSTPISFVKINGESIENQKAQSLQSILEHLKRKNNDAEGLKVDLSKSQLSLSEKQFAKLSTEDKLAFYFHKRKLFEMSYAVLQVKSENKQINKGYSLFSLLINKCEAALDSQCFTAGGMMALTDKGRCDDKYVQIPSELIQYANCSKEQTLCHPLFYGLDNSGQSYCADKGVSCSQLSPLNNQQDMQRIMQSLKKINIDKQQVSKKMDEYINEATKVCQQSEPSKKCDSLLARRAQFNSLLVDFQQEKSSSSSKIAKSSSWPATVKDPFEEARLDSSKDENCTWWCRNKNWAAPVAIVAATLATTVSICKFTHYNFLGICSKNNKNTATTTSDGSTSISIPVAPTAADYTSVQ